MRVDGWSKIRENDAMNLPADIMARRSTEKIKKTIMTTAEHDQLSGMKRTEELKRGMARYNAMRTVEHDQLSGMKRTSDILKGQIDMLDTQISYSHFTQDHDYVEKVQSGQISSLDELNAARDQLQQKKDQIDRQWALGTAKRKLSETSVEARKQLDEYNMSLLNRPAASHKLQQMGYTGNQIKSLAEYQKFQSDYEDYLVRERNMQQFAEDAPALATAASVTMAPFKALGIVESARSVLPEEIGGYHNKGMPTNIYSDWFAASQNSDIIRRKVMEDMTPTERFIYQTGTTVLDGAVNLAVASAFPNVLGLSGEAAQGAISSTMSWLVSGETAADSVYYGIQAGKNNKEALIDGIVEGAIEGLTEKYSAGTILESMMDGGSAWKNMMKSALAEGSDEVGSNWLNRIYDVMVKQDRGEVKQTYTSYLNTGDTPSEALLRLCGKYAKEDGEAFLAGGISGLATEGITETTKKVSGWLTSDSGKTESGTMVDADFEKGYNELEDRVDYERLQDALGKNAPETFQDYQNLKYYSGDWPAYSSYAGALESGNLTPMASFEIYQQKSAQIDHTLLGVKAANGVTITGKSDLFVANTIGSVVKRQSGVDVQSVYYVVTHPTQISPIKTTSSGRVQWLMGERISVLIDADTGALIRVKSTINNSWRDFR